MTQQPSPVSPDLLLAQLDWLRGLAYSLVRDVAEAEDLVQDTMLIALESPPQKVGALRGWLRTVSRNLAARGSRSGARRAARELESSLRRPTPEDIGEIVERAEIQRHLVDSVWNLAEPNRSTVILRYFEGLSTEQVAVRLGVAPGAVRTRLSRAHEQLRSELDKLYGGDRRVWCLAMVEFLHATSATLNGDAPAATSHAAIGAFAGFIGGNKTVWLTAAVVLAVIAGAVLLSDPEQMPTTPRETAAVKSGSSTSSNGATAKLPAAPTAVPPSRDESLATGDRAETIDATASGRVIDAETGQPIAGINLLATSSDNGRQPLRAVSDAAGSYHFTRLTEGLLRISSEATELYPAIPSLERVTVDARDGARFTGINFALTQSVAVAGVVTDVHGVAIAAARVRCWHGGGRPAEVETDASGAFTLRVPRPRGEGLMIVAESEEAASLALGPFSYDDPTLLSQVITLKPFGLISGRLIVDDQIAAAGFVISAQADNGSSASRSYRTETDGTGRFQLELPGGRYQILGQRVEVAPGEHRSGIEIRTTQPESLSISGRVTNAAGEAISASVTLTGRDRHIIALHTESDDHGHYQFDQVPPGYVRRACQRRSLQTGGRAAGHLWLDRGRLHAHELLDPTRPCRVVGRWRCRAEVFGVDLLRTEATRRNDAASPASGERSRGAVSSTPGHRGHDAAARPGPTATSSPPSRSTTCAPGKPATGSSSP